MNDRISQPLPRRALLFTAIVVGAAAFLGTLVFTDDPDMFHHLALGREIARNGLPSLEPFLYPLHGRTTGPAPYWLGSLAIWGWHGLLGDAGLSLLPALVGALLAVVLFLDARPRGARHSILSACCAVLPIALALETYRYRAVARTEIFSALLLAVTLWAIRRFEEGRPRALLALPLAAVAWTNLHPGIAIALVPLGLLVLVEGSSLLLDRSSGDPSRSSSRSARGVGLAVGVLAAVVAASAVNPSPSNPVSSAIRFALSALRLDGGHFAARDTALSNVVSTVGELRGGGTALFGTPVGALLVLSLVAFVAAPRSVRVREVSTVALLAVLPFLAVRFAMFFAIAAAPVTARAITGAVARLPERHGRLPIRAGAVVTLLAAAVATLPLGELAPHVRFGAGLARGAFPVRGTDYLRSIDFEGRLFNTFHFGGYLEWHEVGPPFQDGRGETLPADAAGAMAGPLSPAFAPLDARYRFDALLVAYPGFDPEINPLAVSGIFDPDQTTWALVAFDDAALLYLRRDGLYAAEAERDRFRHVTPANPVLTPPAAPQHALLEYRRAVREAPDCFRCRFFLGEHELAFGTPEAALAAIAPALARARGPERETLTWLETRARAALRASTAGAHAGQAR